MKKVVDVLNFFMYINTIDRALMKNGGFAA